jgi:hypothetical protein
MKAPNLKYISILVLGFGVCALLHSCSKNSEPRSKSIKTITFYDTALVSSQTLSEKPCDFKMLPDKYIQKEIQNLKIGEFGYTVPWAMWVSLNGKCYLNPQYSVEKTRGGTVQMKITRTKEGYIVDILGCQDYRWPKGKKPAYVGQNGPWIPVKKIIMVE